MIPLSINDTTEVNTEINFIKPPLVGGVFYDDVTEVITVPAERETDINMFLQSEFLTANETYLISEPTIEANDQGVWTVVRNSDASLSIGSSSVIHQIRLGINLANDAPVNTPDTTFSISVVRQGSTEPAAVFTQKISMENP